MAGKQVMLSGAISIAGQPPMPCVVAGSVYDPGLGIWGGGNMPYPDQGLPEPPPGTWGGAGEPFPGGGPIIPPPEKPSGADQWQWHLTRYGWGLFPPQADKPQPVP